MLRAAILHECQNYLVGGGGLGGKREKYFSFLWCCLLFLVRGDRPKENTRFFASTSLFKNIYHNVRITCKRVLICLQAGMPLTEGGKGYFCFEQ